MVLTGAAREDLKEKGKVDEGLKNVNESVMIVRRSHQTRVWDRSKKKEEPQKLKPQEGEEGEVSEGEEKPDPTKFIGRKKRDWMLMPLRIHW